MTNDEKNYKSIIFMNKPIAESDVDVIGISSAVDAVENAIDNGAKMIGVIAEYGAGKSSLTEMLNRDSEKEQIKINLWDSLDRSNEDKKDESCIDSLTKTFIYQLAAGKGKGVANHVNKILSRNYGILSFSVGLKRVWAYLIFALFFLSLYWSIGSLDLSSVTNDSKVVINLISALKLCEPIILFVSIILLALGLANTNIAFSKWKEEGSRVTEINELFYAYSYVYSQLQSRKKQKLVIIEDLDRINDKKVVVNFLKELYRFNNMSDSKCNKKKPVFIISIAPEACLKDTSGTVVTDDDDDPNEDENLSEGESIYSKVFEYVIQLKPIHYDDYEIVLRDIINSEPQKKEGLEEILDCRMDSNKLPKGFEWIYKGENLTIREIKDRLNKAIALFIELKNKKYVSNSSINFEVCCAVVYLEAQYPRDFYLITHNERRFSEIIQKSYEGKVAESEIETELKVKKIGKELSDMINNRILDNDFKMYFYSFPKGSYVKNIDEKQICDYIELPNENQYKESDLAEKIKRIFEDKKEKTIYLSIEKVYERGQNFPKIVFENKMLFEMALQIDKNLIIKSLDEMMKYTFEKLNSEDIRIMSKIRLYCINDKVFFLDNLVSYILEKMENMNENEMIERRMLFLSVFKNDINIIKKMYINSEYNLPFICEAELKELNDVNKSIMLMEEQYITSNNYKYVQTLLVKEIIREENREKAIYIQCKITNIADIDIIIDYLYKFMYNNKIVQNDLFLLLKRKYNQDDKYEEKLTEYLNNLPVECLTETYLVEINSLISISGLNENIILKLIDNNLYETPIFYYYKKDKLWDIALWAVKDPELVTKACKNINQIDKECITQIRMEIIKQYKGSFPLYYSELYSEEFKLISNDEMELLKFKEALEKVSGNRITEKNVTRILEYINSQKRVENECYFIFMHLFDDKNEEACVESELVYQIVYGLDYKKVRFDSMTEKQIKDVIEVLQEPLELNFCENAKKFVALVKYLDVDLEQLIFKNSTEDEYIAFINDINIVSDYTIERIKEMDLIYPLNNNIRDRMLQEKGYSYYIVGKILYEDRFDFPMDEVPVKEIVLLYRKESVILKYLMNNDAFIEYLYNFPEELWNIGKCTFEMVQPFQKFKQTYEIVEFVLACVTDDIDIEKYLLQLNEIETPESSVLISKMLTEGYNITYLRREDVFEHIKQRLWENVPKSEVGYKRVFTRKRNDYIKHPKELLRTQNIKYFK